MNIKQIHHVAYRCRDAKETVGFYQRVLGMDFMLAIAEDLCASVKVMVMLSSWRQRMEYPSTLTKVNRSAVAAPESR